MNRDREAILNDLLAETIVQLVGATTHHRDHASLITRVGEIASEAERGLRGSIQRAAMSEPSQIPVPAPLERLFADQAVATAQDTAGALGLDVKVLRQLTDEGLIRAVRRGKLPGYTLAACLTYLNESPPWGSTSQKRPASSSTTSSFRGAGIMDLQARRHAAALKRSNVVVDLKRPRAG